MKKGVRFFPISLIGICLLMGCAQLQQAPVSESGSSGSFAPLAGSWAGTVSQSGTTYPVEMILDGNAKIGATVGSIEYPSLACLGSLIGRKADGINYTVTEQITRGKSKCVDNGIIQLVYHATPPSLDWKWYHASGRLGATATLRSLQQVAANGHNLDKGLDALAQQLVSSLSPEKKPLLAILDFSDLEGRVTAFGRMVGEELVTKLFMTRKVRVVERGLLEKAVSELKFNLSELVDPDRAKRLGRQVGADTIITGTVTDLKTSVKINARMIAVETGDILAAAGVEVIQDQVITGLLAQILSRPAPPQPTGSPTAPAEEKPKEVGIPPQPSSLPVLETESYRITVESVKKSGNVLSIELVLENISSKILPLQHEKDLLYGGTYLLDDIGERWIIESDTASLFAGGCTPIPIAPGAKRKTTLRFKNNESGEGKIFTLVTTQCSPKREKYEVHKIRLDQK